MKKQINERETFWFNHIENWQKLDLSQAEYCRQQNINKDSFSMWKTRYKNKTMKISFVEISTPVISQESHIELLIGNNIRIKITDNFNHDTLLKVLKTMEKI